MIERSRLLLVDDIEENLVALEALLRRPDVEILLARSGVEALELLLQHEIALALIDVQMPQMDGFELAELMRGAERSKFIPIIFVTAGARDGQRVFRGYDSGAVDFLFKPVDPQILRQKADTFIALDQQRKLLAAQYEQLQKSETLLREAVQARDDVLAVVSHDVRNFLQAIKSGVLLLSKPPEALSGEMRAAIHKRVSSTVDVMSRVISDLLDLSNIRNGRIDLQMKPETLVNLLEEASSVHQPLAQEKNVRLIMTAGSMSDVLLCDRVRMLQVLSNLLGNAIKFCRHGDEIELSAARTEAEVCIQVRDTGPGIAPQDLPRVFEAYWSGGGERRAGAGLGLYITKRIVEAHSGRIWIESEPGRGAEVFIALPAVDAIPQESDERARTATTALQEGSHR